MTAIHDLSEEQVQELLSTEDIPLSVRTSAPKVVVVLTQSWCSQWIEMLSWIESFADKALIYQLVYDLRPDFQKLMDFKEETFANLEIPYLRYYHKGELIVESNWLPKNTFAAMLQRDKPFSLK